MSAATIAAVATPPGQGGIGIVRLSGPEAESLLLRIFVPSGKKALPLTSHLLTYGRLVDPASGEQVDECMAVLMRGPRSYTREDVAEIHVHGGPFVLNRTLSLCLACGARLAGPGEFTRRAFLNGRIDLSRAEAVMRLVSAVGEQEHRAALRQLNGGAAAFVRSVSDDLYRLQAGLAACMDYPEEISDEEGLSLLVPGISRLRDLLLANLNEKASRLLDQGLRVVLAGLPNVGKSSLLNALLGEDKAIVTSVPGTTRDLVEGELLLDGVRVRLTDTAGLRETDDPVERIGVSRAQNALLNADFTLLVMDRSAPLSEEEKGWLLALPENGAVLLNKTDLSRVKTPEMLRTLRPDVPVCEMSALDTASVSRVRQLLREQITLPGGAVLTQPRHLDALRRAIGHLSDALDTLASRPPDLAAVDLHAAQAALGEITGDVVDEKLLDTVFSSFCVGK